MPPHKLTLKNGAPVMLLRNMHDAHGHANGTRMLKRKCGKVRGREGVHVESLLHKELLLPLQTTLLPLQTTRGVY